MPKPRRKAATSVYTLGAPPAKSLVELGPVSLNERETGWARDYEKAATELLVRIGATQRQIEALNEQKLALCRALAEAEQAFHNKMVMIAEGHGLPTKDHRLDLDTKDMTLRATPEATQR